MGPLEAAVGISHATFPSAVPTCETVLSQFPDRAPSLRYFGIEHRTVCYLAGLKASRNLHREAPFLCLVPRETRVLAVEDCRKCQAMTATPAEPGDLLWMLGAGEGLEPPTSSVCGRRSSSELRSRFRINVSIVFARPSRVWSRDLIKTGLACCCRPNMPSPVFIKPVGLMALARFD
jgi:hypothetical protein